MSDAIAEPVPPSTEAPAAPPSEALPVAAPVAAVPVAAVPVAEGPPAAPVEAPPAAPAATAAAEPGPVVLRIAGLTDVGRIREHNEDNLLIADLTNRKRLSDERTMALEIGPRGLLFTVCDGMGGAAAGEVASQMAVDVIHGIVSEGTDPRDRDQFAQRLVGSIQEAGARIFLAAKSNRQQRGMGTTSTVAGVHGSTLFVGQVGDSRAYLLRGSRLRQITKDQSLVSKLIEAGQLTEAEAETYEHAHIILQALGTADTVSVDLSYVDARKGDVVMLCSDGLSGLATFDQIREAMATREDPLACCQRLIEMANEAGGHDNITVIVARFEGDVPDAGPEDEGTAYQPYVLLEPAEALVGAHAATSMKVPDLPPPGSDVKHSLSMPPDMPTTMRPVEPSEPRTEIDTETRRALGIEPQRNVLGWVLVGLALGVLVLAAWLMLRPTPAEAPPPAPRDEPQNVVPTPVEQGTPVHPTTAPDAGGAGAAGP